MSTATIVAPEPVVETPTMPEQIITNREIFLRTLRRAPEQCREQWYYFQPGRWTGQPVEKFCVNALALMCTGMTRDTYYETGLPLSEIVAPCLGLPFDGVLAIDRKNESPYQTFALTADWLEAKWSSDDPDFNEIPNANAIYPFSEDVSFPVLGSE